MRKDRSGPVWGMQVRALAQAMMPAREGGMAAGRASAARGRGSRLHHFFATGTLITRPTNGCALGAPEKKPV